VEANQSGSSPESLERDNTFCTITFQKCKKIKKLYLVQADRGCAAVAFFGGEEGAF